MQAADAATSEPRIAVMLGRLESKPITYVLEDLGDGMGCLRSEYGALTGEIAGLVEGAALGGFLHRVTLPPQPWSEPPSIWRRAFRWLVSAKEKAA